MWTFRWIALNSSILEVAKLDAVPASSSRKVSRSASHLTSGCEFCILASLEVAEMSCANFKSA